MGIKQIIAIASAKGGVGKSTICTNLAFQFSKDFNVGILDADIYGPNQHILLDVLESKPEVKIIDGKKSFIPIKVNNILLNSMGFVLDDDKAAMWRGPMLSGAIKQLIHSTDWGELDYLLIDMPPGTGDAYLTIFNELEVDNFILINTSHILSLADSNRTISMLNKLNVNILGYIENNIFNAGKKTFNFFETKRINKLATYSFHERIYNFDPEFNCEESNDVAKKIYEMT